jgi:hypothetical protein
MGYSTHFTGTLEFKTEPTVAQLRMLNSICAEDPRDHKEWGALPNIGYIDLILNDDLTGLVWSDVEKTKGMVEAVNLVTHLMREDNPEFCLQGKLFAQGEESDDTWWLVMDIDGIAKRIEVPKIHDPITCPECEHVFSIGEHF